MSGAVRRYRWIDGSGSGEDVFGDDRLHDLRGTAVDARDARVHEGRADGVYPLEIAAGSDPAIMRERYPDFVLMGGVDKKKDRCH